MGLIVLCMGTDRGVVFAQTPPRRPPGRPKPPASGPASTATPTAAPTASPAGTPSSGPAIESRSDTIKINFPEMDLETVLKNFSAITGRSFILDQVPKGQIRTIGPIGPIEIPRSQAFNLFVLIMSMNGYSVVPTSVPNVYKVVRSADAARENIPVYPPGRAPTSNEAMVTRFISLRYVSASDLANQLTQLTSKEGGQVVAYAPTNTLIIMDTAINIERMLKIIRLLDVPGPEPDMEIIILKYAPASEVANIINQIYQQSGTGAPARTATTRAPGRPLPGKPVPPGGAPEVIESGGPAGAGLPKVIPVERINALIIIALHDTMESIKALIARLDIDMGAATTIHVYYCQNAEAKELATTLSSISGRGRGSQTGSSLPNYPRAENAPNLPGTPPTPSRPTTQPSTGPTTAVISGILGGDVTITADDATNALIIVSSPQDYDILKVVIEKLDIPRRQVFVEAVLLEVNYKEDRNAGVSMHGVSPLGNQGLVFSGTSLSSSNSMTILSSLLTSGGSLTLPSGITIGALGQPVGVPGTPLDASGNPTVTIPSAGMIVSLLASTSRVNVLSTPTLLTTDNKEASIEVGQKIPVQTGSSMSGGGFSTFSISRESVGIKLKITPQINSADNIRLDINTEISGVDSTSETMGPTTSLKTAQTTVIVRDAQTIVIGGLMSDQRREGLTKVPFLGDIPVVGWLFKSITGSTIKNNLIILLTPHIVRSDADAERVRQKVEQDYQKMIEETMPNMPDRREYMTPRKEPGANPDSSNNGNAPALDGPLPPPPNTTSSPSPGRRSATTRDRNQPNSGAGSP